MPHIEIKKIEGINRKDIPKKGITIVEDCRISNDDWNAIKKSLTGLKIYKREKDTCPIGRGNWVCDQYYGDNIFCIKLPIEMEEKDVKAYFQPLIYLMKLKIN